MRAPTQRIAARLATAVLLGACLLGAGENAAQGRAQALNLRMSARLVPDSISTLHYRGRFTGAPFGGGTVDVRAKMSGAGDADIRFRLSNGHGTMRGVGRAIVSMHGSTATVRGTLSITGGSGAYRRIRARTLRLTASTAAADVLSTMRVTGQYTS
jgi:hypothetical protein